jgi:hypothetical protein
VKPVLQALLLADRIYEDKSGKKIIAGTSNRWLFKKGEAKPQTVVVDGEGRFLIPGGAQAGSPSVYISLTNIRRTVNCILRYVNLEQDAVLRPLFRDQDDWLLVPERQIPLPDARPRSKRGATG